jgi:hypothetical protein
MLGYELLSVKVRARNVKGNSLDNSAHEKKGAAQRRGPSYEH